MESISEITNSALQGNVLERLSAQIRENPSAIKRGLEQAVPASLAGLGSYASSENRAEELLGSFRSGDYPHMSGSEVQDVVGDPAATARLAQSSSGFIGRLFGDKQTAVVDAIAKQAGLSRSGASTVLGLATPLVLGAVGRETEERHLDARGLSRFLADQGRSVSGSLPGPLATAIGGAGALGAMGMAASTAPRGAGGGPLHDVKERAHEMAERARGAASETMHRGREHERDRGRESAADRLRGRERGVEYDRDRDLGRDVTREQPHAHARRGTAWKLAALAVAAIAALFLFSRRSTTPDLPRPTTEVPRAAQPATPELAPREPAQPPQQQGQQGQEAQPPEQQMQPQQAAPAEPQPTEPQGQPAEPQQPQQQQPGGVEAETLSTTGGIGALTTLLDGDQTLPKRFVLEGVQFETGSSQVSNAATLDEVASTLKQHADAEIRLDGYADASGDSDQNAQLSEARAESVKQYLVDQGVSADNIETTGESSDRPVASNDTTQGRAQNRRVELVVTSR